MQHKTHITMQTTMQRRVAWTNGDNFISNRRKMCCLHVHAHAHAYAHAHAQTHAHAYAPTHAHVYAHAHVHTAYSKYT